MKLAFVKSKYKKWKRVINLITLPFSLLGCLVLLGQGLGMITYLDFQERSAIKEIDFKNLCQILKERSERLAKSYGSFSTFYLKYKGQQCGHRESREIYLASLSKALTSAIALKSSELNHFSLDDKICSSSKISCSNALEKTTWRQLMNHQSGLGRLSDSMVRDVFMAIPELFMEKSDNDILNSLENVSLRHPVGEMNYSNLGYRYLWLLLDQWPIGPEKILEDHFNLKKTYRSQTGKTKLATFYSGVPGLFNFDLSKIGYRFDQSPGSGSIISTAREYSLFMSNYLKGDFHQTNEYKKVFSTKQKYTHGLMLRESALFSKLLWHNGSSLGNHNEFFHDPEKDFTLFVAYGFFLGGKTGEIIEKSLKDLVSGRPYLHPL